jgi:hypothetical protein
LYNSFGKTEAQQRLPIIPGQSHIRYRYQRMPMVAIPPHDRVVAPPLSGISAQIVELFAYT